MQLSEFRNFAPIRAAMTKDEIMALLTIADDAYGILKSNEENISKLNYYRARYWPLDVPNQPISKQLMQEILVPSLPGLAQQSDNLIRLLSKFDTPLGTEHGPRIMAFIGSKNTDTYDMVLFHLHKNGLVYARPRRAAFQVPGQSHDGIILTVLGSERHAHLMKGEFSRNNAFMAMYYKNEHLNQSLEEHFKPALHETGFKLNRLDDNPKPGLIDTHLMAEIQAATFIVADLSDGNRGVYFEAGYALGLGKIVFFICEESAWEKIKPHFDVNHYHVLLWNKEDASKAASKLADMVRVSVGSPNALIK